jgi:hypothetical protein
LDFLISVSLRDISFSPLQQCTHTLDGQIPTNVPADGVGFDCTSLDHKRQELQ